MCVCVYVCVCVCIFVCTYVFSYIYVCMHVSAQILKKSLYRAFTYYIHQGTNFSEFCSSSRRGPTANFCLLPLGLWRGVGGGEALQSSLFRHGAWVWIVVWVGTQMGVSRHRNTLFSEERRVWEDVLHKYPHSLRAQVQIIICIGNYYLHSKLLFT